MFGMSVFGSRDVTQNTPNIIVSVVAYVLVCVLTYVLTYVEVYVLPPAMSPPCITTALCVHSSHLPLENRF